jgi:trans-aconitate methyltransferase
MTGSERSILDRRTGRVLAWLHATRVSPELLPLYDVAIDRADLMHGHRILDFGCGDGALLAGIRSRFDDCVLRGIDRWPDLLAHAVTRAIPGCCLVLGGIDRVAEGGPHDRILATNVAYLLPGEERATFLRAALDSLSPGGRIVLADPDGGAEPAAVLDAVRDRDPVFAMMCLKAFADARAAGWTIRAAGNAVSAAIKDRGAVETDAVRVPGTAGVVAVVIRT